MKGVRAALPNQSLSHIQYQTKATCSFGSLKDTYARVGWYRPEAIYFSETSMPIAGPIPSL